LRNMQAPLPREFSVQLLLRIDVQRNCRDGDDEDRHDDFPLRIHVCSNKRCAMVAGLATAGSDAYYAIASSAFSRFATVRSMLCSLSRPNSPTRKVLKSGRSSHCSGTPAAVCRPTAANFFDDWMPSSVV